MLVADGGLSSLSTCKGCPFLPRPSFLRHYGCSDNDDTSNVQNQLKNIFEWGCLKKLFFDRVDFSHNLAKRKMLELAHGTSSGKSADF